MRDREVILRMLIGSEINTFISTEFLIWMDFNIIRRGIPLKELMERNKKAQEIAESVYPKIDNETLLDIRNKYLIEQLPYKRKETEIA